MDTSKLYIKMCQQTQEIQELKKLDRTYQLGDFYIQLSMDHQSVRVVDGSEDDLPENIRQRQIWLPRQDQLQEMIFNKQKFLIHDIENIMIKFKDFIHHIENRISITFKNYLSIEVYWLMFLMKEKYNKIWNTETENWETI